MTTTEKLSKAEIAKRLVKHDIVLTPQQVKRTSHADLAAQLIIAEERAQATADATDERRADIEAAAASHPITKVTGARKRASNDRDDCTYKTPIDTRDGDGLLTEGACFSRAEDWGRTRDHGVPEAGGIAGGEFTATFTDMTQVSVDLKTGKVKKLRTIDLDRGSPDADVKPRAAANTGNVVKLPRASKGVNLAPKPLGQQKACRADSKQAAIIDCLVDGATLWELTGATSRNAGGGKDWSESSVRSALHWDVHSVKGYGVRTELMTPRQAYDAGHEASVEHWLGTEQEHQAIVPVYFLVLPEGMDKQLAHVAPAPVKVAANKK